MSKLASDPMRFIVNVGILQFGATSAAAMIVYGLLTTPFALLPFIKYVAFWVVAGALGGAVWGYVMWLFLSRLMKPVLTWLLPKLHR